MQHCPNQTTKRILCDDEPVRLLRCLRAAARAESPVRVALLGLLAAVVFGALLGCRAGEKATMNSDTDTRLFQQAAEPANPLSDRCRALADLATAGNAAIIPRLKALLSRTWPPQEDIENWDPAGAERVVDLHIIRTLHQLGDDSEISRVAPLVAQAHSILQGPDEELPNAIETLLVVRRVEPIGDLVRLSTTSDALAVRNAVLALDRLALPQPPTGQDTALIIKAVPPLTFTSVRLKDEFETIVSLSCHTVALSPGLNDYLARHDYERGKVQRTEIPLAQILDRDVRLLGFDYYVEADRVVICTFAEAATRWQSWWSRHASRLEFDLVKGRFALHDAP